MAHTMEGFLEKKGSGGSVVGRTNWLKRWFVLDGSHLTYFEEFDPVQNKPKKQKGSLSVRGAKIEQVVKHHTREYCFGITRENGSLLMVSAETKDDRLLWMEALDKASKMTHDSPLPGYVDITKYYEMLGLPTEPAPSAKDVKKAYRKKCLTAHPDKGGDPELFDQINQAYEFLLSHLDYAEKAALYARVEFKVRMLNSFEPLDVADYAVTLSEGGAR